MERVFGINAKGATGEYHTDNALALFLAVRILVVRDDFAVDAQFADASSDELSGLRAEIKDNNLLLH